jgi:hypothetical protein
LCSNRRKCPRRHPRAPPSTVAPVVGIRRRMPSQSAFQRRGTHLYMVRLAAQRTVVWNFAPQTSWGCGHPPRLGNPRLQCPGALLLFFYPLRVQGAKRAMFHVKHRALTTITSYSFGTPHRGHPWRAAPSESGANSVRKQQAKTSAGDSKGPAACFIWHR